MGTLALAASALVACSDSSSSSGPSGSSTYDPTAPVKSQMGVDDVAHTITVVEQERVERCIVENNSFTWQEKLLESDTAKFYYSFAGDSLILGMSKKDHDATVLVGGTPGSLYGTWRSTDKACTYDIAEEEYDCSAFSKPYYYQYTFEDGSVTSQLIITEKDHEAEALEEALDRYNATHAFKKYAISKLTTSILKGIVSGDFDNVVATDAFKADSNGFESLVKSKNLKFEFNSTATSLNVTFTDSKKNEYSVSIEYGNTEMAEDGDSYKLNVTVSYGERAEVLKSEGSVMTSKLCSASNEDYFETKKAKDPETETKYTYVSSYAKSNIKLFRSTLEDMFEEVSAKLSKGTSSSPSYDDDYGDLDFDLDDYCDLYGDYLPEVCKASAKETVTNEEALMRLYKAFTK